VKRPLAVSQELENALRRSEPALWINPHWQPIANEFRLEEVKRAEARLTYFAPLLALLFPELESTAGLIESPLLRADRIREVMFASRADAGRWFIKADHALPVAGSIKARGGIYEVLSHAEALARDAGILEEGQPDPRRLASPEARALFSRHEVVVGSTGNLGLSIGIMAATLGFQAKVHMSADAKEWKKTRLRNRGVEVIEHRGDYGAAVAAGRTEAGRDSRAYFVDDENSAQLFSGYSVAAIRLAQQLQQHNIAVDSKHPLFVYLPCGVGGAPGGIAFGLRQVFGDDIHCFFAEPVACPCMLVRLAARQDAPTSIHDIGLDGKTEADGLAVASASELVVSRIRNLVSGVFTVTDSQLFEDVYRLKETENVEIEPSAAAGLRGPCWILDSESGQSYLRMHGLSRSLPHASHIVWTTGGSFVPSGEYQQFWERGRSILARRESNQ
jgi:D-serine dehydratase